MSMSGSINQSFDRSAAKSWAVSQGMIAQSSGARSTAQRQVTNRTFVPNAISGSNTHNAWRCWQMSPVPVQKITIGIANWYVGSATSGVETGAGSAMTCYLSIEYPRGTFTRVTWGDGGPTFGTIADAATGYATMTLPFTIPAFARFRICADQAWTGSGRAISTGWSNACDRGNGDEYMVGAGSDNTLNSTVLGSGLASMAGPVAVIAESPLRAFALVGDSILAGVNDTVFDPSGGRGLLGRAIAKSGFPHINFGIPGDRASYAAANYAKRLAVLQAAGITDAILELGVNDYRNSRTAAQMLADRATIRGLLAGIGIANIFDTTLTPTTTSTDTWKTAANQTIENSTQNTERVSFNTSLRTTRVSGSAGTIDVASIVETNTANESIPTQDGGVFLPGMVGTSDGIHITSRACMAVEPLVRGVLA